MCAEVGGKVSQKTGVASGILNIVAWYWTFLLREIDIS